jgi:hypothetical protein
MDAQQQVQTIVGTFPMSQLHYTTKEYYEPNTIIIAREWFYTGADREVQKRVSELEHPYVKRDVWATILCGQSVAAEAKI